MLQKEKLLIARRIGSTEEGYYYPQIDEPIANIYISSTGGENRMAAIIYHFFNTSSFIINGVTKFLKGFKAIAIADL